MKNAKKVGIAIVQIVIAGIIVFVAIQHCPGNKPDDVDVGRVTVEEVEQTPVPSATATPESATSETANADGYGEETLVQTEDGSYLDGEASGDESSLSAEETSEQPAATATPAPAATATPAPAAMATPAPAATPQPTAVPQPADPQPEQSQNDDGAVPDWFDSSDTGVTGEEYEQGLAELDGLTWE